MEKNQDLDLPRILGNTVANETVLKRDSKKPKGEAYRREETRYGGVPNEVAQNGS